MNINYKKKNKKKDSFITLEVPENELVKRILSRGEGRSDDTPEKVRNRLEVYKNETEPVLNYYKEKDIVEVIDGVGTIDNIFDRVKGTLGSVARSEEHTSELQSRGHLVCRLLLEKKNK